MQSFEDVPFIIEKKRARKHSRRGLKVVVIIMLLCGLAAVGIVVYFSFTARTFKVKGRTLYAVRLYTTETESEATERAEAVKAAGGAGYIYNDGVYSVVAAVFGDKADATTVAGNNQGEVIEIAIAAVKLPLYEDVATSQTVSDCMRYPFTVGVDHLERIALSLENKTCSDSAAALQLAAVKNELVSKREQLDAVLSTHPADSVLMKAATAYTDAAAAIETVGEADGRTMAARVQYAAVAVAVRFCRFMESIG